MLGAPFFGSQLVEPRLTFSPPSLGFAGSVSRFAFGVLHLSAVGVRRRTSVICLLTLIRPLLRGSLQNRTLLRGPLLNRSLLNRSLLNRSLLSGSLLRLPLLRRPLLRRLLLNGPLLNRSLPIRDLLGSLLPRSRGSGFPRAIDGAVPLRVSRAPVSRGCAVFCFAVKNIVSFFAHTGAYLLSRFLRSLFLFCLDNEEIRTGR